MARLMAQLEKVFGLQALLLLIAATAAAQTLPDFSGKWTALPEAPAAGSSGTAIAPATMGSGWGAEITITQDASTLTVERAQFSQYDMQPPMRFTYNLDESESRNTINMGRGPQALVSKAGRRDASLVITTTFPFSHPESRRAETLEVRQVLSLDPSGSLVVTTTRGGVAGGPASTSTTTYRKN